MLKGVLKPSHMTHLPTMTVPAVNLNQVQEGCVFLCVSPELVAVVTEAVCDLSSLVIMCLADQTSSL